jgi:hypothetical protein
MRTTLLNEELPTHPAESALPEFMRDARIALDVAGGSSSSEELSTILILAVEGVGCDMAGDVFFDVVAEP